MEVETDGMIRNRYNILPGTLTWRLGILIVVLLVMMPVAGGIGFLSESAGASERNVLLITSVAQAILAFILPAWLAAKLTTDHPASYLGLDTKVNWKQFAGAAILLILSAPAMNRLVEWNENLSLPESMAGLEQTMRMWEDAAAATTKVLLGDTSVWGLFSGIVVMSLLTGFAEEMAFRAGVQKAIVSARVKHHFAIWATAFIFSAMHMQFYGFVPRLLMGAAFGYIFYSTRSLWVAAFAHAMNNGTVVVSEWLIAKGMVPGNVTNTANHIFDNTVTVCISAALTLVFIFLFWNRFFADCNGKESK